MASSKQARAFVDANVLIEIVCKRKQSKTAIEVLRGARGNTFISALTGHLVVHFKPDDLPLSTIGSFLDDFTMLDLGQADFDWAFSNCQGDDFEDALQLAVAVRNGCSDFYTFDKVLVKSYAGITPGLRIKQL